MESLLLCVYDLGICMACSILPSRVEELLGTVNWLITGTHHKNYHELYLGFSSFFPHEYVHEVFVNVCMYVLCLLGTHGG